MSLLLGARLAVGVSFTVGFWFSCRGHFLNESPILLISLLSGAGLSVGFLICFLGEGLPVGGQFS